MVDELRTERLLLRSWRAEDREPFAALNADPVVMAHYPSMLTREESDAFADAIEALLARRITGKAVLHVPQSDAAIHTA